LRHQLDILCVATSVI